jgi:hypothetical protein
MTEGWALTIPIILLWLLVVLGVIDNAKNSRDDNVAHGLSPSGNSCGLWRMRRGRRR